MKIDLLVHTHHVGRTHVPDYTHTHTYNHVPDYIQNTHTLTHSLTHSLTYKHVPDYIQNTHTNSFTDLTLPVIVEIKYGHAHFKKDLKSCMLCSLTRFYYNALLIDKVHCNCKACTLTCRLYPESQKYCSG